MKTFVAFFLVSFYLIETTFCDPPLCNNNNCPLNEVYSRCGTGKCEATCWNQAEDSCGTSCVPGCICAPGFARDPNTYKCVPAKNCPLVKPGRCPYYEEWSETLAGCQKTCDSRNTKIKCVLQPGCVCKNGYIRSPVTNQCIHISECRTCPPGYSKDVSTDSCKFCCRECPDNEAWNNCGPKCEQTCKTLFKPPTTACITLCQPGCFCKDGYMRDDATGECIPKGWCKGKFSHLY